VVLNEEARSDLSYGGVNAFRQPLHGEEQLVLLRLQAVLGSGGFAEVKKAADLAAKFGQASILLGR